jgi:hypothetical protein
MCCIGDGKREMCLSMLRRWGRLVRRRSEPCSNGGRAKALTCRRLTRRLCHPSGRRFRCIPAKYISTVIATGVMGDDNEDADAASGVEGGEETRDDPASNNSTERPRSS